jgi:catechol 2,3-dioxygenase-like lactoylglutathione lyase family enzyme
MSRAQLALNVSDVDAAVAFYRRLFGAEPAKRRPGHARFPDGFRESLTSAIESGMRPRLGGACGDR